MIAHNGGQCTGSANLFNDLREPATARLRIFDAAHLLTSVDHEAVRNAYPHLVFDERAVRKVLDPVVQINIPPCRRLLGFLSSTGTTPSRVRIKQSGLPEIPQRAERNTSP
jgi:hypothetical protein